MVTEEAAIAAMRATLAAHNASHQSDDDAYTALYKECEQMRRGLWATNEQNAVALASAFVQKHARAGGSGELTGMPGHVCYCTIGSLIDRGRHACRVANPPHNPDVVVYREYMDLPPRVRFMVYPRAIDASSLECWCHTLHNKCDCHPSKRRVVKKRMRFYEVITPSWLKTPAYSQQVLHKRLKLVVSAMKTRDVIRRGLDDETSSGSESDGD